MNCKESAISNYFFLELDYLMYPYLSKPYFKPINQHSFLLWFLINRFICCLLCVFIDSQQIRISDLVYMFPSFLETG